MLSRLHVAVASDGSANVTLTPASGIGAGRPGYFAGVFVKVGTLASTTDITFTDHETGQVLLTLTNVAASAFYSALIAATDVAGAAITGVAARQPIGVGGIDVVVAQPGNSKAGDLYLYIDQGAQS